MDSVYSLNTHPFTGQPMPKEEHRHLMTVILAVVLAIAVIGGAWYWFSMSQGQSGNAGSQQPDIRAQVAALLESAPVHASQAEINNVASLLAKSKVSVTDSERQAVAESLAQ